MHSGNQDKEGLALCLIEYLHSKSQKRKHGFCDTEINVVAEITLYQLYESI